MPSFNTCMYVYMYICVCVMCVLNIYIFIYIYIYIYIFVHICVWDIHAHMLCKQAFTLEKHAIQASCSTQVVCPLVFVCIQNTCAHRYMICMCIDKTHVPFVCVMYVYIQDTCARWYVLCLCIDKTHVRVCMCYVCV
jgi:hypothetical protein